LVNIIPINVVFVKEKVSYGDILNIV